jgi:hypothetical protein
MDDADSLIKAEMLAALNEVRRAVGKPPLTTFPERSCTFCGLSEEEAGVLFRSNLLEVIHICRMCCGKAQRLFTARIVDGTGGEP